MMRHVQFFLLHEILLFISSLLVASTIQHSFHCAYTPPQADEVGFGVKVDASKHRSYRQTHDGTFKSSQSLRFEAVFDQSVYNIVNNQTKTYVIDQLIPTALKYWSGALSVRRMNRKIIFERKCYPKHPDDAIVEDGTAKACINQCSANVCGDTVVPDIDLQGCFNNYKSGSRNNQLFFAKGAGRDNVDFILYVSSLATSKCKHNETVAYAAHCLVDEETGRPIAGHTNICPRALNGDARNHELLLSTVKHEMVHALGFSTSLFTSYRDRNGNRLGLNNVLKNVTDHDWQTLKGRVKRQLSYIVTPKVTKFVRDHFGCPNLIGAELENQGGEGTCLTHWEKRLFENEAMAGTHTQSPAFSNLTLALLDDTGWYTVDYSHADTLHWGRNLGCDFASGSCFSWISKRRSQNQSISPYCDVLKPRTVNGSRTTCTLMRDSVAICNLQEYDSPLPEEYQNFAHLNGIIAPEDLERYGGSVELADYCPFEQEFDWKDARGKRLRDSRCEFSDNQPLDSENMAIEEYGVNSRCFLHGNISWTARRCKLVKSFPGCNSGCHQFECMNSLVYLVLDGGVVKYPCYKSGQVIPIKRVWNGWAHEGQIVCPSCELLCNDMPGNFQCAPPQEPIDFVGDRYVDVPCGVYCRMTSSLFLLLTCVFLAIVFQ